METILSRWELFRKEIKNNLVYIRQVMRYIIMNTYFPVQFSLCYEIISKLWHYTLNEIYNRPPCLFAASSENKIQPSKVFSFIHRRNPWPNASSYFISKRHLLLAQAQSEQRYPRFKKSQFCYSINDSKYTFFMRTFLIPKMLPNTIIWHSKVSKALMQSDLSLVLRNNVIS